MTSASWVFERDLNEDEVHTGERSYCGDLACWCHTDVAYHEKVTSFGCVVNDGFYEYASAMLGASCPTGNGGSL